MNRHVCCRLNVVWLVLSPYNKLISRTEFYSTEFYIYARLPIRSLTYETDQYFHDLQFSEKFNFTCTCTTYCTELYQYFPCDTSAALSEVMGSNPVQAWIFFRPYFHYCSSSFLTAGRSLSYSRLYPQFKYMTFIYPQSFIHHFTGLFGTNIGLLVQLVERCTGIAWVMGSNPVQTWIFFKALFSLLLK